MNKTLLLAVAVAALCPSHAEAAYGETYDMGALAIGTTYTLPSTYDGGTVVATVTPTASGAMSQTGMGGQLVLYADAAHTTPLQWEYMGGFGDSYEMDYQVEAGVTYHLYAEWVNVYSGCNHLTFKMAQDVDLAITDAWPPEGATVTTMVNGTGEIVLNFNAGVVYSQAEVACGSSVRTLGSAPTTPSTMLAFNIKEALLAMYASGVMNEDGGTPFELRVSGVQTPAGVLYGADGTITLGYIAGAKAVELVKTNFENGRQLRSYYPEGDPEGVLQFEFDKPLSTQGATLLTLGIGNVEGDGTYYFEEIPMTVSGNTATADLCGKLRDLTRYASLQGSDYVSVGLINARGADGNPAAGDGDGSAGSYYFGMTYYYIEPANIVSEFTPASGASLAGVDKIEIWFNHADAIAYDGVKFEYADGDGGYKQAVVPMSEIAADASTPGEMVLTVPVPEQVKGHKDITVTLNGLKSIDGYDHSLQVMARYDAFVVTLVSPIQNGGSYYTTGDDDFVFTLNAEPAYARYDFYNADGWAYGAQLNYDSGLGVWTAYNGNYPCHKDADNYMLVRTYESEAAYWEGKGALEQATFHFIGLTEAFRFSDYQFVSIDPEPLSEITPYSGFFFTVEFSGLVRLDPSVTLVALGSGASTPFDTLMPMGEVENIGGEDFSHLWRLYPPAWVLDSSDALLISIVAYDQDGYMIAGNMGGGQYDYLSFSYTIKSAENLAELELAPAAGEVPQLEKIKVTCGAMAVGRNWNYTGPKPAIYDADGQTVCEFGDDDVAIESDIIGEDEMGYPIYDENTWATMTLPKAIADKGTYTLVIPQGYFLCGSQFDVKDSAKAQATYAVTGNNSIGSIIADGHAADVYNLQGIMVKRGATAEDVQALRPGIYIINGQKVRVQ